MAKLTKIQDAYFLVIMELLRYNNAHSNDEQ
ncbi:hypothetical protein ACUXJ3_000453 [Staphylococcus capitis]